MVVCITPPPVPFTVIVYVPLLAPLFTVTVMVEDPEPGAGMERGLKPTVTLLGWPLADKEMAEIVKMGVKNLGCRCPIFLPFCVGPRQASPKAGFYELPSRDRSRRSWLTDAFGTMKEDA